MRILVVRTSALGDTVLATPVLRALHERYPGAELHFVTQPPWADVLEGLPFVSRVWRWHMGGGRRTLRTIPEFSAELRREGAFDLAIDLQNSPMTRLLLARVRPGRTIRFVKRKTVGAVVASIFGEGPVLDGLPAAALYLEALEPLGFPTHAASRSAEIVSLHGPLGAGEPSMLRNEADSADLTPGSAESLPPLRDPVTGWDLRPAVRIPDAARAKAEALLAPAGGARIVALAPGGRWATKRWPADRFAKVGDALADEGAKIVLCGGPGDVAELRALAAAMKAEAIADTLDLDVAGLCAVIERADLLVGCDSAPNHLAQAVGTPVVTVFGPTSSRRWGPLPGAGAAVSLPIGCSPCSNFGKRPCPLGHHACMLDLGPEPVIAAALAALREGRMGGGAAAGEEFLRERMALAMQVARSRREVSGR
ncbi:MAG TPA: glycosyltransferase family 9 protein [Vulgatibacter sp.]|nr:glycosyltransferase family 9 protein [Vulgatibacter sp.]